MIFDEIYSEFNKRCADLISKYPESLSMHELEKNELKELIDILASYKIDINNSDNIQRIIDYADQSLKPSNYIYETFEMIEFLFSDSKAIIVFFCGYILSLLTNSKFITENDVSAVVEYLFVICLRLLAIMLVFRLICYILRKLSSGISSKEEKDCVRFINCLKQVQIAPDYVLSLGGYINLNDCGVKNV